VRRSEEARDALVRFCQSLSEGDVASFDELVSLEAPTLVVGSAPGEWLTDRDRLRFPFEVEGMRLETRDPVGYAEGSLGWVVDRTSFFFPDGSVMQSRLTAIMRREDGRWKVVHMHHSVGVPEGEVVELQRRWTAEGFDEAR
jgi:hypothetical protein